VTAAELSVTEVDTMDPCCASGYWTAIATASSDYPHCWQCKLSSKGSPSADIQGMHRPHLTDPCGAILVGVRSPITSPEHPRLSTSLATFFVEPWTQASNPLNRSGRWSYGISNLPHGTVIKVKELSS